MRKNERNYKDAEIVSMLPYTVIRKAISKAYELSTAIRDMKHQSRYGNDRRVKFLEVAYSKVKHQIHFWNQVLAIKKIDDICPKNGDSIDNLDEVISTANKHLYKTDLTFKEEDNMFWINDINFD